MRVELLVGVAAVTMAVLPPTEPPAGGAALPPPEPPPPAAAAPPAEEDVEGAFAQVDWDDEPTATTITAPAPTAPTATTASAPTTTTTTASAPTTTEPPTTTTTSPPPTTTSTEAPTTTTTSPPPPTTTTEAPAATTEAPEPEPEEAPAAVQAEPTLGGGFADLRSCESGGDYGAVSPGGAYRGAYQFDRSTWNGVVARMGRPDLVGADPAGAAPGDQDDAAAQLYSERGAQPWPHCGRYL